MEVFIMKTLRMLLVPAIALMGVQAHAMDMGGMKRDIAIHNSVNFIDRVNAYSLRLPTKKIVPNIFTIAENKTIQPTAIVAPEFSKQFDSSFNDYALSTKSEAPVEQESLLQQAQETAKQYAKAGLEYSKEYAKKGLGYAKDYAAYAKDSSVGQKAQQGISYIATNAGNLYHAGVEYGKKGFNYVKSSSIQGAKEAAKQYAKASYNYVKDSSAVQKSSKYIKETAQYAGTAIKNGVTTGYHAGLKHAKAALEYAKDSAVAQKVQQGLLDAAAKFSEKSEALCKVLEKDHAKIAGIAIGGMVVTYCIVKAIDKYRNTRAENQGFISKQQLMDAFKQRATVDDVAGVAVGQRIAAFNHTGSNVTKFN